MRSFNQKIQWFTWDHLLSDENYMGPELNRSIGIAQQDFKNLCRVWGHSNLSRNRESRIYDTYITSRL
eukprot:12416800-Karenia_brevis.AAC.1